MVLEKYYSKLNHIQKVNFCGEVPKRVNCNMANFFQKGVTKFVNGYEVRTC